jgi:uncharacterized membrane protein
VARLVHVLEIALSLAYPFALHLCLSRGRPELAAAALLIASTLLFVLGWFGPRAHARRWWRLGLFVVVAAFAGLALRLDNAELLLLYPLLVNLSLLVVFASSLFRERSLIETFARLHRPELEPEEVRHCRRATWAWSAYFLFNVGVVAALTFFAPLGWWTLYTGVVSYVLSALVGLSELVVRIRRFGPGSAGLLAKRLLPILAPLCGPSPGRTGD